VAPTRRLRWRLRRKKKLSSEHEHCLNIGPCIVRASFPHVNKREQRFANQSVVYILELCAFQLSRATQMWRNYVQTSAATCIKPDMAPLALSMWQLAATAAVVYTPYVRYLMPRMHSRANTIEIFSQYQPSHSKVQLSPGCKCRKFECIHVKMHSTYFIQAAGVA
jgi:hypothetical protein